MCDHRHAGHPPLRRGGHHLHAGVGPRRAACGRGRHRRRRRGVCHGFRPTKGKVGTTNWSSTVETVNSFLSSGGNQEPICFYDSSHNQNGDTFKNQYGFIIYWMGGPILWASKGHKHAGLSVAEDEYMTLTHAYKQAQWLRNLLDEMGFGYLIRNPLLMLNIGNLSETITALWADIDLPAGATVAVTDMWSGKSTGNATEKITATVRPHDVAAFLLATHQRVAE